MKKILVVLVLMFTLSQVLFSAETNLTRFERAGNISAFRIDKDGNIRLFLNNGIISTNNDCASFDVITDKMKGNPRNYFENRMFATSGNKIHIFEFESKKWADSLIFPYPSELINIIEKNDNEYLIGIYYGDKKNFILYNYEIQNRILKELFKSNGLIENRNFVFNSETLYKFTDSNIYKLDFKTNKLKSIYFNRYGKSGSGFINNNFLYFMESNYENSFLCTIIKKINLENEFVTEVEKTGYVNNSTLKNFGDFIFYKTDKKILYDVKNDTSYLWPHLDDFDYFLKDKNGDYYSIPNLVKYDGSFKIIKNFLYYNYNDLLDYYRGEDKLVNNMKNNELLIYTENGNVLKTNDKRFVYQNITEKLILNSEIKRIINDSKNNNYLFSKNGDVNYSLDNGITWNFFKLWEDDKQLNNVEFDSNGNFLILTDKGLYYYDPDLKQLVQDENFKDVFISALAIYQDFYIITSENGVYRYFRTSNKVELISDNKITDLKKIKSIVYKSDLKFYIFSENNGVYKYNNSNGKFVPFNYGFNPKVITNANIYRDSILIVNADKNVYVNKIGVLNWEKLEFKKNSVQANYQNLQITQNNEFILNVYNNLYDSIKFGNELYSYFVETDENIEKLIHSESGVLLFRLSKDKEYIYMFNNSGRFTKIDANTGEIYEIKQLMTLNTTENFVSGCDLQSNDSILVFGQMKKGVVDTIDVLYYDIINDKYLDSFKINHNSDGPSSSVRLAGLNFHFLRGDTTLFVSKNIIYVGSGSFVQFYGETNLYKLNQLELIRNINNQFISNIRDDEQKYTKLCFSIQMSEYKGSKEYFDNLFLIKQNYDTLDIIKQAKVWGDKSTARIAGHTLTNDGKYAIYHRDSVLTSLYIINVSDFNLNKTVDLGSYDKIPLFAQSQNDEYLYFANSNFMKFVDASTYETVNLVKFNNDEYAKRVRLLENSDENIIYILTEDGILFKLSSIKPGIVVAGFDYLPKNPKVGDIVNFKNISKGLPTSYKWFINNQLMSIETEFGYIFETDGLKTVTLVVNKGEESDTITKSFNVSINTSINDEFSNNTTFISPNPASDFITIQFSNKELQPFAVGDKVQIFDVLGIEVMTVETWHAVSLQRIDVSHLSSGVYFMRIGNKVEKFVKM